MLRDITIGQYYPTGSVIHKLDPRVKLAGTFLFIISIFTFKNYPGYIVSLIYLGMVIFISKVPLKHILKGIKPIIFLMVFTAVIHLFFTSGDDILFEFYAVKITYAGLKKAVFIIVRLLFLITGSAIMTYTTTPNQLTEGIEKAFGPLNKAHIPVHEFALMMSIALRFIPILMEEADKIIKAQSSRGADFEEGNIIKRISGIVSILIPLLVSAMERAKDLALAMDARCYHGGEGRTKMKPLRYTAKDYISYGIILVYMVTSVAAGRFI